MNNKLKATYLEFHILQSFPVSCLNRDDVGSPKTAVIGGVERARVSSQAWKRAIRLKLQELGSKIGTRTKKVDQLLVDKMLSLGVEQDKAVNCAAYILSKIGEDTLILISEKEINGLVDILKDKNFEVEEMGVNAKKEKGAKKEKASKEKNADDKLIAKVLKGICDKGLDSVDIALFGRMVAKMSDLTINGACSVAHAISTHKVENEVDFFTALDDIAGDVGGSSHLGETEFNSATYYRYISLNLGQLAETLFGDAEIDVEQLNNVVGDFIKAVYLAVPNGRQNTQTAFNPWDYAQVLIRKGQPLQLSFDKPVVATKSSGYSEPSIQALKDSIAKQIEQAGDLYRKEAEFELGGVKPLSITEIVEKVQAKVSQLNG